MGGHLPGTGLRGRSGPSWPWAQGHLCSHGQTRRQTKGGINSRQNPRRRQQMQRRKKKHTAAWAGSGGAEWGADGLGLGHVHGVGVVLDTWVPCACVLDTQVPCVCTCPRQLGSVCVCIRCQGSAHACVVCMWTHAGIYGLCVPGCLGGAECVYTFMPMCMHQTVYLCACGQMCPILACGGVCMHMCSILLRSA